MTKFSREKVLLLHQLIAEETGGEVGLRDRALLDAALPRHFRGWRIVSSIRARRRRRPSWDLTSFSIMPFWTATSESACM